MDNPQATYVYNVMHPTLRAACKQTPSLLISQIEQYKLSDDEADIFKQLIMNNGKYNIDQNKTINNLRIRRDTIIERKASDKTLFTPLNQNKGKNNNPNNKNNNKNNNNNNNKNVNKPNGIDENYRWNKKLVSLSCVRKSTNKPLSVRRRKIAKQINETVDLDGVNENKLHKLIVEIGDLMKEYNQLQTKLNLQWIKKLAKLNIKKEIESHQGRKNKGGEVTHCVNKIAFNICKWNDMYADCSMKLKKLITKINNAMVKFGLATFSSEKQKFVATLTKRQFNFQTQMTNSVDNGRTLYDFATNIKSKFIKIIKKFENINYYVKKQILCNKYQSELKKIDQKTRAKNHKNANNNRNDNKRKKDGLEPPNRAKKKQKQKIKSKNKCKKNSKSIQTNQLLKYWGQSIEQKALKKKRSISNDNENDDDLDLEDVTAHHVTLGNENDLDLEDININEDNDSKLDQPSTGTKRKNSLKCVNQPMNKKRKIDNAISHENIEKVKLYLNNNFGDNHFVGIEKNSLLKDLKLSKADLNKCLNHLQEAEAMIFVIDSAIYKL
eukprot:516433_1